MSLFILFIDHRGTELNFVFVMSSFMWVQITSTQIELELLCVEMYMTSARWEFYVVMRDSC